jgi:hypothetical protein
MTCGFRNSRVSGLKDAEISPTHRPPTVPEAPKVNEKILCSQNILLNLNIKIFSFSHMNESQERCNDAKIFKNLLSEKNMCFNLFRK